MDWLDSIRCFVPKIGTTLQSMEYQMGSFQQIVMGATCLAAAFFFGSYLHNRPTENKKIIDSQIASADPIDSIFAFGKKSANTRPDVRTLKPAFQQTPAFPHNQEVAQLPASSTSPGIDPTELAPSAVQRAGQNSASVVPAAARRPVVPDFSELASRFRNTPLELNQQTPSVEVNSRVHESERVPWSGVFEAPEMVIRQPENAKPIRELRNAVDQVEETIRNEFTATDPKSTRWRVNRSQEIDQFRSVNQTPRPNPVARSYQTPQQDTGPRETIDDVLSHRSADWLKEDEPIRQTWATDPPQEGWMTDRRREVTEQAALRNQENRIQENRIQESLEVEDPGNRFRSVMNQVDDISRPQPDFDTSYYTPSPQRQDAGPPRPRTRIQTIRSGGNSNNWNRQSNIQTQAGNTYEIQPGDTLQSISMKFYGSAANYLEIYKANREVLDRINSSPTGVVIEIPNLNN